MEMVYLVLIIVVVMYANKAIKASLNLITDGVETAARMGNEELAAVEADQTLRHAENDVKRADRVNDLVASKKTRVSARDIIKLRKEGKL